MTLVQFAASVLCQYREKGIYIKCTHNTPLSLLLTPKQFSWMQSLFNKELYRQFPKGNPLGYISINRRMWKLKPCGGKACVPGIGWRTGNYGLLSITHKL